MTYPTSSISHSSLPGVLNTESPPTSQSTLSATERKVLDTAGAYPDGISFVDLQEHVGQAIGQDALRDAVSNCLKRNFLCGDFSRFSCTDDGITVLVEDAAMQLMEPDDGFMDSLVMGQMEPDELETGSDAESGAETRAESRAESRAGSDTELGNLRLARRVQWASEVSFSSEDGNTEAWNKISDLARVHIHRKNPFECYTENMRTLWWVKEEQPECMRPRQLRPESTDAILAREMDGLAVTLSAFVGALVERDINTTGRTVKFHDDPDNPVHALFLKADEAAQNIWDKAMNEDAVTAGPQAFTTLLPLYEVMLTAQLKNLDSRHLRRVAITTTLELERLENQSEAPASAPPQGAKQTLRHPPAQETTVRLADYAHLLRIVHRRAEDMAEQSP